MTLQWLGLVFFVLWSIAIRPYSKVLCCDGVFFTTRTDYELGTTTGCPSSLIKDGCVINGLGVYFLHYIISGSVFQYIKSSSVSSTIFTNYCFILGLYYELKLLRLVDFQPTLHYEVTASYLIVNFFVDGVLAMPNFGLMLILGVVYSTL